MTATFRQGDLIASLTSLPVLGADDVACPLGAVVISQTCDVVRAEPPTVQVARMVQLSGSDATEASAGKRPRYVEVPEAAGRIFADLDLICTLTKRELARHDRRAGTASDVDARRFGRAVARRFGRFAFPDDVAPWLKPLASLMQSKGLKEQSPEGAALGSVVELRIEAAGGWVTPPYTLTLVVIVRAGVLPTLAEDEPLEVSAGVRRWVDDEVPGSAALAGRILQTSVPAEVRFLWDALGDAWASRCCPAAPTETVSTAVHSISAEVIPEDEYTLDRYRRSEQLDLDHLSAPTPL